MAKTRATARRAGKRATTTRGRTRPEGRARSASSALTRTAQAIGRTLGHAAATVAERIPWGAGGNAIDLLEADHRRLEELLKAGEERRIEPTNDGQHLEGDHNELTAHELIEEKVLYPALKPHAEAKEIVLEGYQEHHVADVVLKELQRLRVGRTMGGEVQGVHRGHRTSHRGRGRQHVQNGAVGAEPCATQRARGAHARLESMKSGQQAPLASVPNRARSNSVAAFDQYIDSNEAQDHHRSRCRNGVPTRAHQAPR